MIGRKLAHHEITSHLGSGGMGEVYQASDSKLGRNVAIKLLPEAFTHDQDRAARFEREARVLASLNHPNVAGIYGVEESGGRKFLVMELVGGETLAERIGRSQIPVEEALGIAAQIAEALEAAHEKGVVHRDLKPANIKITSEGKVKVLDFGLAKAFAADMDNSNLSNSPTLTMAATNAGIIIGTAAYMSPEQARGKTVDTRADVWAFGTVMYEMLTGKKAFHGEDVTEILAAVVMKEPSFDALPGKSPGPIRNLLRRCLDKNKKRRLQHIVAARWERVVLHCRRQETDGHPGQDRRCAFRALRIRTSSTAFRRRTHRGRNAHFFQVRLSTCGGRPAFSRKRSCGRRGGFGAAHHRSDQLGGRLEEIAPASLRFLQQPCAVANRKKFCAQRNVASLWNAQ
jgi:serine/threonine protein kinase